MKRDLYPYPLSEKVTSSMKGNRRVGTKPEKDLRSSLHQLGFRFRKDYPIDVGSKRKCRPDIVFTKKKIAVYVDGCFWHLCPEHGHIPSHNREYWVNKLNKNASRDEQDSALLAENGWTVVRIWEHISMEKAVQIVVNQHNVSIK